MHYYANTSSLDLSLSITTTVLPLLNYSSASHNNENYLFSLASNSGLVLKKFEGALPLLARNISVTINCAGKKALTDNTITKTVFLFSYLMVFLTSISGNSLVVYVVLTSKNMQTVTNIFITNLAAADLLVCITSLWLTPVYTYIGHWIWGDWLCYGLPLFQGTSIFISTLTLMSIALDRYFVICRRSKSVVNINDHMSMQVCIAIITLIWMVSLLLVMPYAVHMYVFAQMCLIYEFGWKLYCRRMAYVQQPCDFWLCIEDWAMEDLKSLYGIIVVSLQFVVPFVIIGHSYTRIWSFLNKRHSLVTERESEFETQRKKRLLRMLIIMPVLFAICWLPFNMLNFLRDLKMDRILKPYFSFLFLSAHLISMTATMCNPILYAWMNQSFREEFTRAVPMLDKICKVRQTPSSSHRPRIITDCAPARIRRNCGDNVKNRKKTFTSLLGTPTNHQEDSLDSEKSCSITRSGSPAFEMQQVKGSKIARDDRNSLTVNPLRHSFNETRRTKSASVVITNSCLPKYNGCEERKVTDSLLRFGISRTAKILL